MMEIVIVVVAVCFLGAAEWKHHKSGNGKRFEQIHELMDFDKK
jgi:hypothetical protein